MQTALVISGGGSKGAFAVGAIEVLREKDITFDLVTGTSTGALIAPFVALDEIEELVKHYTTIRTRDVIRKNWRHMFVNGIYHTRPIEARIRKILASGSPSFYDRMMASNTLVLLCAVSLQTRKVAYFGQREGVEGVVPWINQETFIHALLGSMSQPAIMTTPFVGAQQFIDGGVREITPIRVAVRAGVDRVYVIINSAADHPPEMKLYTNIAQVGIRALNLMLDEILLNDVRVALLYNDVLKHITNASEGSRFHGKRHIDITVIRPAAPLPSDGLTFEPASMEEMRQLGQKAARAALPENHPSTKD